MLITIFDYLKKNNIDIENTVYRDERRDVLDFPLILGDFLSFVKRGNEYQQFYISKKIAEKTEEYKIKDKFFFNLELSMEILSVLLQMLREQDDSTVKNHLKEAREIKRKISQFHHQCMEEVKIKCAEDLLGKQELLLEEVIWYKNTVYLTTMRNLSKTNDKFKKIKNKQLCEMPLFVSGMEQLHQAISVENPIGVEGGPCLLGHDEVMIEVVHRDKRVFRFDFAAPRAYEAEEKYEEDLHRHVEANADNIIDIKFINRKKNLTKGDFNGLLFVFEIAEALDAKAVIPLVDLSYRKYISKVCESLDESLKRKTDKAFQDVIYEVSDIFIEWIAILKKHYPMVKIDILHERNETFCNTFYNRRNDYLTNYKKLETITNEEDKRESIIDYVTMPALPFYKWGIKDIVQIDCISELDCYRRCRKIHTNDINLCGIFYSETLSLDKKHSDYSAKFINKKYIE